MQISFPRAVDGVRNPSTSLRLALLSCAAIAPLLCSCNEGREALYPVRGQITDEGERPASGALVVFHPQDSDRPGQVRPLAYVDEQGEFALTSYEQGDGAPVGDYVITIEWRQPPAHPFAADREGKDRLLGHYSNPQTSKLNFTVERAPENVVPQIRVQTP